MKKRIYKYLIVPSFILVSGLLYWSTQEKELDSQKLAINNYHQPKADKPDEFIKLFSELRTRSSETYPDYSTGYRLKELTKANQAGTTSRISQTYEFIERGPGNVPGRTRALIVDPDDPNHLTWFAGGVGGGVWKTVDGGVSWVNKTDNLPNLAISWLVMAESNRDILYAGTGEGWGSSTGFINGSGIYKSVDRGETWTLLSFTAENDDFQVVNRIIIDPLDPDIVLAVTSQHPSNGVSSISGVFKSVDGGFSWTQTFFAPSWVQQIVADPLDFNVLYSTVQSVGIYKSTDAGDTWTISSTGLQPEGRIEMAVSPVNTSRLYASVQGSLSGNGADLYVSDDAGLNWQVVTQEDGSIDPDFLGGQGWYDNTILAHPFNEDIVYAGGVNIFKFEMRPGTVIADKQFIGAEEQNTSSFLSLVNFGAAYYGGKLDVGDEMVENFVSIEVRFGPDGMGGYLKQFAHRFTIPAGQGSGVAASDYSYQDYVEVPFQVWDISNNRQLMVAFRDQQDDGIFNLFLNNTDNADAENNSREYIFMSSIDYNDATPDPGMAANGKHELNNLYFIWPYLSDGGTWDETNLPASKFIVTYEGLEKRLKVSNSVTDAYFQFDGHNTFSQPIGATAQVGTHPDQHNIVPIIWDQGAETFQLLLASDGGIYSSEVDVDPGIADNSFTMAGNSYNTSQFYSVDKAPGENRYVGGLQDNGSWMSQSGDEGSSTSFYQRVGQGDGFGAVWNHSDPQQLLTTVYNNAINKSTNGGTSFTSSTSGLSDVGGGEAPFITELENLHSDPEVVFSAGVSGVWRSENFADSWKLAAINSQWRLASTMKIRISHANSHIIWAGTDMQETPNLITLHVSTDEGLSFMPTNNYTNVELGRISGLATHPVLDSTAFALFSFAKGPKILRTNNLGESWYDISGFNAGATSTNGFPDVALYDLLVMPYDTTIIWAGTEIGVFESTDAGVSWHILSGNMPATAIWDMKIVDDQVVLGTHGRGIWSATIAELPGQVYLPEITKTYSSVKGELNLEVLMRSGFDSTHLYVDGALLIKINQATEQGTLQINTNYTQATPGIVHLRSFYRGVPYVSHTFGFELEAAPAAVDSYENNFNTQTGEFSGSGFSERLAPSFNSRAIHSQHPYQANKDAIYTLSIPIRVKATDALINFKEIAIVEPGEGGIKAGDNVLVQGSLDGINWINLLPEYDASLNEVWKFAFADGINGNAEMYRFRVINLLDSFSAGDEILIRFKLSSDDTVESWGWAIDNLKIQTNNIITGLDPSVPSLLFSMYPNPLQSNSLSLTYESGKTSGTIQILDLEGRLVLDQQLSISGKTTIDIPDHVKNGIYFVQVNTFYSSESHKLLIRR